MTRFVYVDLETGGLDPNVHAVTEIGAVAFALDFTKRNIGFEYLNEFQTFVKPDPNLSVTPFALDLQGKTYDEVMSVGVSENEALDGLYWFCADILAGDMHNSRMIAHYAQFDYGFLRAMCKRNNRLFWDDPRCDFICTRNLWITLRGMGVHTEVSDKLENIMLHYHPDWDKSQHHHALNDANTGVIVYHRMMCDLQRFLE